MSMASEAFILLFRASTVTPGGAKCFLSSLLLHYLSIPSHQGHRSSSSPQHLPPPPTTTRPLRWRSIMCCYLPFAPPTPPQPSSLSISCPPASVPHRWVHILASGLWQHEVPHEGSQGSYLSVFGSAAALAVCYLCERRQSVSHTELIHILGALRLKVQLSRRITITVHEKKKAVSNTSCLWWAGYVAARVFFCFFLSLTVHRSALH